MASKQPDHHKQPLLVPTATTTQHQAAAAAVTPQVWFLLYHEGKAKPVDRHPTAVSVNDINFGNVRGLLEFAKTEYNLVSRVAQMDVFPAGTTPPFSADKAMFHSADVPSNTTETSPLIVVAPDPKPLPEPKLNPFASPHPLLSTTGAAWTYQRDNQMEAKIADRMVHHYKNWKEGKSDKLNHTLFLATSGVGTGKSRLLMELPDIVTRTAKDEELKERLGKPTCLTFNVSFENGTAYVEDNTLNTLDDEIGMRMMFQMYEGDLDWSAFRKQESNHKSVGEVVSFLSKRLQVRPSELTIFLLVDGVQKLPHEGTSKRTPFYACLATVASLVNQTRGAFTVGACASTVYLPVNQVLADSPQRRLYLQPRKLDGGAIIQNNNDPTLGVLVDDMGGHGRALECLDEALVSLTRAGTKLQDYGYSKLANDVRAKLLDKYPDWKGRSKLYGPALEWCLSGVEVEDETVVTYIDVPSDDGRTLRKAVTVDDLLSLGLFQIDSGRLDCAYIWIWALSNCAKMLEPDDYGAIQRQNDERAPLGAQCWQHWDEFSTRFRSLKARVLHGKIMPVTKFHAGALFYESTTTSRPVFTVQKLDVERASRRYKTASESDDSIICERGTFRVSDASKVFLNGSGAPAGDAFLGLTGSALKREIHQYKLLNQQVTAENVSQEHQKSAAKEDLFLLFSVKESDISSADLPDSCGLIDGRSFKQYYGPLAGRAFYASGGIPSINAANRLSLEAVNGIGPAYADVILKKRPFTDFADARTKTQIPPKVLRPFYPDQEE